MGKLFTVLFSNNVNVLKIVSLPYILTFPLSNVLLFIVTYVELVNVNPFIIDDTCLNVLLTILIFLDSMIPFSLVSNVLLINCTLIVSYRYIPEAIYEVNDEPLINISLLCCI